MINSHLTVLESSAIKYASATVFQIPQLDAAGRIEAWQSITYQQFRRDVELFAQYWKRVLREGGAPVRSVIGMWYVILSCSIFIHVELIVPRLGGMTYVDVLHIYGISRAGYIPQLFSIRLPNPTVIYELLRKANASALIYDPSFESVLLNCPVPAHRTLESSRTIDIPESLPSIWDIREEDTGFIFHTSGSTSGSPKLVPMSYRWLNSVVVKSHHISMPHDMERQDVTVYM